MIINNDEIKRLRISKGLTLKDVAVRLKVTEATISRYESGQIKRISPKVMLGYAKLFNVPINSLYENAEIEWVNALEEAGLHDPRVAGFIEYLEEQAQKEAVELNDLSPKESELIQKYRAADDKIKNIVDPALGVSVYIDELLDPNDEV